MAKYIIDVPDEKTYAYINDEKTFLRMPISLGENEIKSMFAPTMLRIKPYIEPDRKAIEDEVWEFAHELSCMKYEEIRDCFGIGYHSEIDVVSFLAHSKAKAKYDAWKKQKEEEIHVGDEVFVKGDPHKEKAIVLRLYQPKMYKPVSDVLWADGSVEKTVLVEKLMRTGRRFDEVNELLKKIRGEEE